jgi:pyruvate dehydrogenase E2 component (dihydrolipoamide acetyltransferase)
MAEVVMPRLSDSMEEGTILQWLKAVGDEVAVGDELVEIETDKANMAYESDVAGTLTEILVQQDETVAIGTPIAQIGDSGEGSSRSTAGPVGEEASAPALGF